MAKQITEITKRDLREMLENVDWWGRLEETEFLSRLYSIDELPSSDGRYKTAEQDMWQHRINNADWPKDWVFSDDRFGLSDGGDEDLLRFLTEMLHPAVRKESDSESRTRARVLVAAFRLASLDLDMLQEARVTHRCSYAIVMRTMGICMVAPRCGPAYPLTFVSNATKRGTKSADESIQLYHTGRFTLPRSTAASTDGCTPAISTIEPPSNATVADCKSRRPEHPSLRPMRSMGTEGQCGRKSTGSMPATRCSNRATLL